MADNLLDKASILLTPTANNVNSMLSIKPTNGDGDFTFSRNGNASRVNSSGNIVAEGANLPRINYENGCGNYILEDESTNLIAYSNDYADAYWEKASSGSGIAPIVTSNDAISPDGTQNADRIEFNATTSGSNDDRSRIRRTLTTLVDGADYTFSFYAKSTNGTDQKIGILFDNSRISNETITSQWQRFEATTQQSGTSSICGLDLRGASASESDILVYGIQIEQQSYATSYIPTLGASSTRLRDLATNSGNSTLINSTEGTLYAEIAALANSVPTQRLSLSSGNNTNRIYLQFSTTLNRIFVSVVSSSSIVVEMGHTLSNITNFNKIAVKYKQDDFALWINGVEVATDTSGSAPLGLSELAFNDGNGTLPFFCKTKALAVYKEALTDAELTALTTI